MISPQDARPRLDLPWLRHRRTPEKIDYTKRDAPSTAPSQASSQAPPATPSVSPSLDLSTPAPSAVRTPPAQGSGERRSTPTRRRPRTLPYPRVEAGKTVQLVPGKPTVTLTRLQSGIGHLRLDLVHAAPVGSLMLGLVCERLDGSGHVVQALGDARHTPETPLPLVRLDGDDTLLIDLHLIPRLTRALVYLFNPGTEPVDADGMLTAVTHDRSRVETPITFDALTGTLALLTLYNVHGELVLRSETRWFDAPPEQAALAYGHRVTWLEGRVPARATT